jgi:hypothetical protein
MRAQAQIDHGSDGKTAFGGQSHRNLQSALRRNSKTTIGLHALGRDLAASAGLNKGLPLVDSY